MTNVYGHQISTALFEYGDKLFCVWDKAYKIYYGKSLTVVRQLFPINENFPSDISKFLLIKELVLPSEEEVNIVKAKYEEFSRLEKISRLESELLKLKTQQEAFMSEKKLNGD